MTGQPTLLFCVGAPKAGTSWLYQHLAGHPEAHLRAIKELHYFSAIDRGSWQWQIRTNRAKLAAQTAPRHAASQRDIRDWLAVLKRRAEDVEAYLGYLTAGRGDRRLVADITPAYSQLSEDRLRMMSGLLPDVRFLYLLRDPVSRLWSHLRMLASRAARAPEDIPAKARALLADILAGHESAAVGRGDYATVVGRLQAAVPTDRLMVMTQDEMLTQPGLLRLWRFLGIGRGRAHLDRRTHQGVPVPLPEDDRARLRQRLQPQYAFVEKLLGQLPDGWQRPEPGVAQ